MGVLSTVQILSAVVFCTLIAASAAQSERRSRVSWVRDEQAPYHVSIWFLNDFLCSGTLIAPSHILTVAHCVANIPRHYFSKLTVKTGTNNLYRDGEIHYVQSIAIHPNFTFSSCGFHRNDIAVIKLKDFVEMSRNQQTITLSWKILADGTKAVVIGLARNSAALHLRKATSTIISNKVCQEKVNNALRPNQFCTFDAPEPNVCVANRGSPLVYDNKLVGMLSWVGQCGSGFPNVYVSIAPYRVYIAHAMFQKHLSYIL